VLTFSISIDPEWLTLSIARARHLPARVDTYLAALIVLPFIILYFDSNVFFSQSGWLDAWIYYSHFLHLSEFKQILFPNTYYGSRMPWIVAGYLVNQVFSATMANYVLHLAVYYSGALALYSILKQFYNRNTAFLGVIAFTCYPFTWRAVGTDYPDGFGLAAYLVTLALLTRAATRTQSRFCLGLAGISFTAIFYTNTVWMLFSPALFLYYLYLSRTARLHGLSRSIVHFCIWFGAGGALLTLILGIINSAIDGNFWFYLPSIIYTIENSSKPQPWHSPTYAWVGHASWLAFSALAILTTIGSWMRSIATAQRASSPATPLFRFHFLLLFLIFALLQLKGLYMLEWPFYASYLIPAIFLTLTPDLMNVREDRWSLITVLAGALIFLLPWTWAAVPIWAVVSRTNILLLWFAAAIAILLRITLPASRATLVACLVTLSLVNLHLRGTQGMVNVQANQPSAARNAFVRMTNTVDAIDRMRQGSNVLFWFNSKDPSGNEFDSINSFFLWGYTWLGRNFPAIDPQAESRVQPGALVTILSSREESETLIHQANGALKPGGLTVSLLGRHDTSYGGVSYSATFVTLGRDMTGVEPQTVLFKAEASDGLLAKSPDQRAASAFPLDKWRPAEANAEVAPSPDGLSVRTGSTSRWSYGAIYAPLVAPEAGKYAFIVKYQVLDGRVVFGALNEDKSAWLGQASESFVSPRDRAAEYIVNLRKGQKFWLLITNNRASARASTIVIKELRAYRYSQAAAAGAF
jgi:hypothetical protein